MSVDLGLLEYVIFGVMVFFVVIYVAHEILKDDDDDPCGK